jgi:hypothetical protein
MIFFTEHVLKSEFNKCRHLSVSVKAGLHMIATIAEIATEKVERSLRLPVSMIATIATTAHSNDH